MDPRHKAYLAPKLPPVLRTLVIWAFVVCLSNPPSNPLELYCPQMLFFILISMLRVIIEPGPEISNNVVCATSKGSDQPAHTCSLIRAFASRLNIL